MRHPLASTFQDKPSTDRATAGRRSIGSRPNPKSAPGTEAMRSTDPGNEALSQVSPVVRNPSPAGLGLPAKRDDNVVVDDCSIEHQTRQTWVG